MRAVGLVLRARLRQYWKSWLALSALVPYGAIFSNQGAGSGAAITARVLPSLAADPQMARVSVATVAEISVNGHHVRGVAVTAAPGKGPALIPVVDGRRPRRDQEIMLGATTMRDVGPGRAAGSG
jgi:hypothetical protein